MPNTLKMFKKTFGNNRMRFCTEYTLFLMRFSIKELKVDGDLKKTELSTWHTKSCCQRNSLEEFNTRPADSECYSH